MGRSFKLAHCKRNLVSSGKQAAYKLSGTKSSLSSLKRVPRPLLRQESSCSNRQHHSGVIHKQGRRYEVGLTMCPTMEHLDLVSQETSDSQSLTHSRPSYPGWARPSRVVSPSRGLLNNMQQVEPAPNTLVCHKVQQQVASVCVTGTRSPGHSSGCTQSATGLSGCILLPLKSHSTFTQFCLKGVAWADSDSTFTQFCLKGVAWADSELYHLGPVVAAQQIHKWPLD